jgi:hypothetical protein
MSADWDIGKLFVCKRETFIMPTEQLAEDEYVLCHKHEAAYILKHFRSEYGEDIYHIPANHPFMVIYGQDGSNLVKVLFEDKIGWLDFNSMMFERYEDDKTRSR